MFSYTLLFKYKYDYEENDGEAEMSFVNENNTTNSTIGRGKYSKYISKLKISANEIILLIWIFALIAEEVRQVNETVYIEEK